METLSVTGLREYLESQGISAKTLENLSSNMVSGLALTLLDDDEFKQLVPIIGDRAVLRNIVKKGISVQPKGADNWYISSVAKAFDKKIVTGLLNNSTSSGIALSDLEINGHALHASEVSSFVSETDLQSTSSADDDLVSAVSVSVNSVNDVQLLISETGSESHSADNNLPPFCSPCSISAGQENCEFDKFHLGDNLYGDADHDLSEESNCPVIAEDCSDSSNKDNSINLSPSSIKMERHSHKTQSTPCRMSKKKPEPPLPRPFEVPWNFPPLVTAALSREKPLYGMARTKFITSIAQAIHRYKSFPTSEELDHVIQQVHAKWPFLLVNESQNSRAAFKVGLNMRMAYLRKPEDAKRGGGSTTQMKELKPKKKTLKLPTLPFETSCSSIGEDKKSLKLHQDALMAELKRVVPNREVVKDLMDRTFPTRRSDILNGHASVAITLKTYSALQFPVEILREFDRIFGKEQASSCKDRWASIVPKLLLIDQQEGRKGTLAFGLDKDETNEESRSIIALVCLYNSLPDVRVKTDISRIITIVNVGINVEAAAAHVPSPQPCLIAVCKPNSGKVEKCYLVVEKKVVTNINTKDACVILFATFFVFNVHYPLGCNNFYTALETILLDKPIPGRKPRVATLLSRINKANY